ncbi:MAG: hypothetical protein ACRC2T_17635 [Thermoguttaceae bacterium]
MKKIIGTLIALKLLVFATCVFGELHEYDLETYREQRSQKIEELLVCDDAISVESRPGYNLKTLKNIDYFGDLTNGVSVISNSVDQNNVRHFMVQDIVGKNTLEFEMPYTQSLPKVKVNESEYLFALAPQKNQFIYRTHFNAGTCVEIENDKLVACDPIVLDKDESLLGYTTSGDYITGISGTKPYVRVRCRENGEVLTESDKFDLPSPEYGVNQTLCSDWFFSLTPPHTIVKSNHTCFELWQEGKNAWQNNHSVVLVNNYTGKSKMLTDGSQHSWPSETQEMFKYKIASNKNGKYVVVKNNPKELLLYNVAEMKLVHRFDISKTNASSESYAAKTNELEFVDVVLTSDDKILATISGERDPHLGICFYGKYSSALWNAETGDEITPPQYSEAYIWNRGCFLTADEKVLVMFSPVTFGDLGEYSEKTGRIAFYNAETGKRIGVIKEPLNRSQFSEDGKLLIRRMAKPDIVDISSILIL